MATNKQLDIKTLEQMMPVDELETLIAQYDQNLRITEKDVIRKEELERLEKQHGYLTAKSVLDSAKTVDSPLHDWFEWDDSTASEKYRLMQARMLMTRVKVVIADIQHPGYVNVNLIVNSVPTRGYVSLVRALSDAELSRQVINKAVKEIEYWQQKYQNYQELNGLINQDKLSEMRGGETVG